MYLIHRSIAILYRFVHFLTLKQLCPNWSMNFIDLHKELTLYYSSYNVVLFGNYLKFLTFLYCFRTNHSISESYSPDFLFATCKHVVLPRNYNHIIPLCTFCQIKVEFHLIIIQFRTFKERISKSSWLIQSFGAWFEALVPFVQRYCSILNMLIMFVLLKYIILEITPYFTTCAQLEPHANF